MSLGSKTAFLASWLALSVTLPAQEARLEDLNARLVELYQHERYDEAAKVAEQALRVAEARFGAEHATVGTSLQNLAVLYQHLGRYGEAEPLFKRALGLWEKAFGPEHADVGTLLNNLGQLYEAQANYREAEPLLRRALAIRDKVLGPYDPDVATTLSNLGAVSLDQGNYADAEPLLKRALAIREKVQEATNPDLAGSLSNLASLYADQGRYGEAEPLYRRALTIWERGLGPDHPNLVAPLQGLALFYRREGKYGEAEELHKRALAIHEHAWGPDHPDVASSLHNLAGLYMEQRKYGQAEPLHRRALANWEKALGSDHPNVAEALNSLGVLYHDQGKDGAAEALYERALAIREKALGPNHPATGQSLQELAVLQFDRGRLEEANVLFDRRLANLWNQFEYRFTYMSEQDRLSSLDSVSDVFPFYFSFCWTYKDQDPAASGRMYDVLLWQKGLVAQSLSALRSRIEASGDPVALALLDRLTVKKAQLAKLLTSRPQNPSAWRQTVDALEREADEIERDLVRRSRPLAEEKRLARVTWRDVQKALKPGEAAVEFARFPFYDRKRWTGQLYVALVLTPETKTPLPVLLGGGADLEQSFEDYRTRAGARRLVREGAPGSGPWPGRGFSTSFWDPLEAVLPGVRRIYLSPDGLLNHVAWGVLLAADGQPLLAKYDVRTVTSTKAVLRERRAPSADTAVLIGNPQFDLGEAHQRAAVATLELQTRPLPTRHVAVAGGIRSGERRGWRVEPLPATGVEIQAVQALLAPRGWQVKVYSGARALEEAAKGVKAPRIVHVATHGFFLPDQGNPQAGLLFQRPSGREDPMVRSGLLFAGASRVLGGLPAAPDLEDGVLTAYEAMGLDLQGTELVVLSACETGLGQVQNGEGVLGLPRALRVAGAEAVLMSLWSVPDHETEELMALFYAKWLSGKSKYEALREAQLEMRAVVQGRYGQDLPYYWGAFVLVGS